MIPDHCRNIDLVGSGHIDVSQGGRIMKNPFRGGVAHF